MDAADEPSKPTPTAAPPLLSVGPVNQENTKVSPLIQLQHCLQCWLSLHTCNELAMLPLRMLI